MSFEEEINRRIESKIKWNHEEKLIRLRQEKWRLGTSSIDTVLDHKMRWSMLGHFLYELNCVQLQEQSIQNEKIGMYNLDHASEEGAARKEKVNDLTDDLESVLSEVIRTNRYGVVTKPKILNRLKILRITGNSISEFKSRRIKKLNNLELLVLIGNGLQTIKGFNIPCHVKYLELFLNSINNLKELCEGMPEEMIYLGLNRNLLTDDIGIPDDYQLVNLIVLDLGDNNIVNLEEITEPLNTVAPQLTALTLKGNPCAYLPDYFNIVVKNLQNLKNLDGEFIAKYQCLSNDKMEPGLLLNCYRLIGLVQPTPEIKNNKKTVQTFHLEIEMPLMDGGIKKREESKLEKEQQGIQEDSETEIPKAAPTEEGAKKKPKKEEKKSKPDSKNKKNSPPPEPDIHDEIVAGILAKDKPMRGVSIKSNRMAWSKIIEFEEPAIKVLSPDRNLNLLRDTFRSEIIVRVILLKVIPPPKGKPKTPKVKKGETPPPPPPPPEEEVVHREVVAKVPISLTSVNWNKNFVDYAWDKMNPHGAVISENLKELNYAGAKGKKSKQDKKSKATDKGSKKDDKRNQLPLPQFTTCHFSIGIIKNPIEIIPEDNERTSVKALK